jgi:hypothetical protein
LIDKNKKMKILKQIKKRDLVTKMIKTIEIILINIIKKINQNKEDGIIIAISNTKILEMIHEKVPLKRKHENFLDIIITITKKRMKMNSNRKILLTENI